MWRDASHAFQVSIGVAGTNLANWAKKLGCAMTTVVDGAMACGLAHAIQSKPGISMARRSIVNTLLVLSGSRASAADHWAFASAVSSAITALASRAGFGRDVSVKIRVRY